MFIYDHMTPSPVTVTTGTDRGRRLLKFCSNTTSGICRWLTARAVCWVSSPTATCVPARPSTVARSKERGSVEEQVNNTPVSVLMTRDCLYLRPHTTPG